MHTGRFVSSVIAVGSLFFFLNGEMAYADDAGWMAAHQPQDGRSCASVDAGSHAGGGCGFLGFGCIGSAIAHAWDDTGGVVVHSLYTAPWHRIGSDALGFGEGLLIGAFIGVGVALAAVTFPVWATVVLAVAGVALLGYGIYSTVKNWNNIPEAGKFNLLGNTIGGILSGWGVGSLLGGADASVSDTGTAVAAGVDHTPVLPADLPTADQVLASDRGLAADPVEPCPVCP